MSRSRDYLSYNDLLERRDFLQKELVAVNEEINKRQKRGNLEALGWTCENNDTPIFSFDKLPSRQNPSREDCSFMNDKNKSIMLKIKEKSQESQIQRIGDQIVESVQTAIIENKIKKKPIPIKKQIQTTSNNSID